MLLYKYLSPKRIDVLEHARIRFTQPNQLNDPFESRPIMVGIRERCRSNFIACHPTLPAESIKGLVDKFIDEFPNLLGNSMVVLSLSATCNNQLMWSHYCDSHKGFVIGFDSESLFPEGRRIRVGSTKVHYSEGRAEVHIAQNAPQNEFLAGNREFFLTKGKDWEYEKEYRVLADATQADTVLDTEILLYNFPSTAVREVILGCRTPRNVAASIDQIIKTNYHEVTARRARLNDRKFQMDIDPPANRSVSVE